MSQLRKEKISEERQGRENLWKEEQEKWNGRDKFKSMFTVEPLYNQGVVTPICAILTDATGVTICDHQNSAVTS